MAREWTQHFSGMLRNLLILMMMFVHNESQVLKAPCKHNSFYCASEDPARFYRCINGVLYTFRCPGTLHFSASQQMCQWPGRSDCENADRRRQPIPPLSGSEDLFVYRYGKREQRPVKSNRKDSLRDGNTGHGHRGVTRNHQVESVWINQPASMNAWWRPAGVDPSQWQDVTQLSRPSAVAHQTSNQQSWKKIKKQQHEQTPTPATKTPKNNIHSHPTSILKREKAYKIKQKYGECSHWKCKLPSCHCPGTSIPHGLSPSSTPQMVMLTFDDEVSAAFYGYYQRLFRPGRYNPNGCPIRATVFVSGSGTNYDLVYPLFAAGLEIASHSVTHRSPYTWWANATYQELVDEAAGMRHQLVYQAGIPVDVIQGFRVPYLQVGGDNMFRAIFDSNFVYDSSLFAGSQWEGGDPVWPFTLDYTPRGTYCQHGPCPNRQYPGLWEVPVQPWYGLDGQSCSMPDGCSRTADAGETLKYLKVNFMRYYNSNRAPLGLFLHARWFNTEHNLEGLDRFLDYLLTLDDVFIVTPSQVIEWMKTPTSLNKIRSFPPWGCQEELTTL